jgi:RND superfamily putative drug exporter
VRRLRTEAAALDPGALVGGSEAADVDAREASVRDLQVITPLILAVVVLVLVALLRALVAPLVLILTVVLSFFAALGAGSLSFRYVFGFPALDYQVPLLAFLFLVALGVDYNIFLVSRARDEALQHGTRRGIVDALALTGGVITSAGILLAAVFTVLGVLPVIVLTEIGIIVGLGVLLDTLLVRTVLVPALVHVLGDFFWAPSRLSRTASARPAAPEPAEQPDPEPRRALV